MEMNGIAGVIALVVTCLAGLCHIALYFLHKYVDLFGMVCCDFVNLIIL